MNIRPARRDEAPLVLEIMLEAFEAFRHDVPPTSALNETEGTVLAEMDRGEEAALCFEGHQAVACVRFYSDNGLYFHRLAVRPACQGRGIGKAMIAWLEREAIARGERSLACRVRASSPRNVALYKALGFVVEREVLAPNPDGNLVRTVHMRKSLAAS